MLWLWRKKEESSNVIIEPTFKLTQLKSNQIWKDTVNERSQKQSDYAKLIDLLRRNQGIEHDKTEQQK